MKTFKLGLQVHAVREAFAEDPKAALIRVAAMGYKGVEFNYAAMDKPVEVYKEALEASGLECYSSMASWAQLQPDKLEETLRFHKELGVSTLLLGMVDAEALKNDPTFPEKAVAYMNELYEIFKKEGFSTGYHAHDLDFKEFVDGKPFYEYVCENTPKEFMVMIDTGNIQGGNGSPVDVIRKFPGRSPIVHIKGYSQAKDYTTPVWESEIDWDELFSEAVSLGNTSIFSIEFGKRGDYEPFDRAEKSLIWLKEQVAKIGG